MQQHYVSAEALLFKTLDTESTFPHLKSKQPILLPTERESNSHTQMSKIILFYFFFTSCGKIQPFSFSVQNMQNQSEINNDVQPKNGKC